MHVLLGCKCYLLSYRDCSSDGIVLVELEDVFNFNSLL